MNFWASSSSAVREKSCDVDPPNFENRRRSCGCRAINRMLVSFLGFRADHKPVEELAEGAREVAAEDGIHA